MMCRDLKNTVRTTVGTIRRKRIRNTTVDSTPKNNIFREYIFSETKLLPNTAPYFKPIPIPPSRPNDFKHIAVTIKPNDYKHIAIVRVVGMHIG